MAAASSLAVRCGKTFSILNAEETETTTRFGRRTIEASRPANLHHHHMMPNLNKKPKYTKQQTNKNKKMQMIIAPRSCLISNNLDYNSKAALINSTSSSSSSSSSLSLYMDPIFRTEFEISNGTREKQQKQQRAKARENKVGGVGKERQIPPTPPISAEKLDEWIKYSVSEIVSNIGEAPLLVQIYSKKKGGSSSVGSSPTAVPIPLFERSKAEAESWAGIKKSWDEGSPIPDGIILVEQLKVDQEVEDPTNNNANSSSNSSTKTWGVVIQGRGSESASSCYILKTCRVGSAFGFCTHFCLVRAKCFGEIADLQLKNSWLLN